MMRLRSGIGYDIHRIKAGKGLMVGGVCIAAELAAQAHSDGDVLIHSLIDALLGAMGQPDIGELFPDTDPRFKDMAGVKMLENVASILARENYQLINADCIVIIEQPKLAPFKERIRESLASVLQVPKTAFSIKAKTKEKLGPVGRGEAVECFSSVFIGSRE
jgi:2-C-methyl-D-erythritol 2,4-cyclodiphosphate synthase